MIELQHDINEPESLISYRNNNPAASPKHFDDRDFALVKAQVRSALHQNQGGLCAYCEKKLTENEGQIDHIKPKSGKNAHPHLCFSYFNYAHSCITVGATRTCGQKKSNGLLPIEPSIGCNDNWDLSTTNGFIQPRLGLSRHETHKVTKTRDMLGLNANTDLVQDRFKWLCAYLNILKTAINQEEIDAFLQLAPYKYILNTI